MQSEAQILHDIEQRVGQLHQLAEFCYWQRLRQCSNLALPSHPAQACHRPRGGSGWGELLSSATL
ncbi:hypothetical protein [Chitinibacter sp. GC72]|uniref:hypothetical protein n=1 Tax=Chitinibacter sp. GC72 TaxID=1526917 RepID=UPI0012F74ABE|nr:hypothetical protein [Chitinibacter sp. GC72]